VTAYLQSAIGHSEVLVREFQDGDENAFTRLNKAWIEKYFGLEDKDRATLQNPRRYIVESGGQLFLAVRRAEIVGCVALVIMDSETYEIMKMAVDESVQGQGVGRALMNAAMSWAKEHGARRLWLETNHVLTPAIGLYESCGFKHLPKNQFVPSPYQRSDVQMELWLGPAR